MYLKFIPPVILIFLLSGCFLTPPSRSYSKDPVNISILKAGALNIDHIKPVSRNIEANKNWQNTGVFIENGEITHINASGSWSPAPAMAAWSGPEGNILWAGEVPGITGGALIAKLGHSGHPFEIGLARTFKAQDYGMLYLAMNDPFRFLYDNQGKVTADIHLSSTGNDYTKKNTHSQGHLNIVSYHYNEKTRKGSVAARTNNNTFSVRQYLISKIGEIASSKNIAIQAGKEPLQGGSYELLNESNHNGILELKFKTLW